MSVYNEKTMARKIIKKNGVILKLPKNLETNFITFGIVEIAPGENTTEHFHDTGEEFVFIIEGEGCIILDKKKHEIIKGDLIFIKSHQKHQIINKGKKVLKILFGVSPPINF